jgi:predicted DNA-binding transcriptional regulator YafY
MAKESFDKEIQFLRLLVLTSGAYNRQQFAERLGISVHTFDKTTRRLKEVMEAVTEQFPEAERKQFTDTLRFSYYASTDPILLFLYRAKSIKESETIRLSLILSAMNTSPRTALELMDICNEKLDPETALPDEKTIRSDLKYLEQVGVIRKVSSPRPYRYVVNNDLLYELTDEELVDLYDFVDIMANTQVPSVIGYLFRDNLKKHIQQKKPNESYIEPFLYKYHYYSRILDESHLFQFLKAIQERRKVKFLYFTPKSQKAYSSKNTNPMFAKDIEGKLVQTLPLKVVYDHQYGRWYLLGTEARFGVRKYRIEGITQVEEYDLVTEEIFLHHSKQVEHATSQSWLIDTGQPVKVRVRFFSPGPGINNFVKERVKLQGQWGTIVEEDEESFIYEIVVNGTTEIRPWIRSFGSSCEVLEPLEFRRDMIAEWKGILTYYESV